MACTSKRIYINKDRLEKNTFCLNLQGENAILFTTKSTYFINHNSFALVKSIPIPHMSNIQYKFTVLCFMNSVTAKYKNSSETLSCIKSYAGMSLCVVHIVHPNKFVKLRKFHRFSTCLFRVK